MQSLDPFYNPKYLTVDNLYVAEQLTKARGYKTLKVVSADPSMNEPKKWLLIKGKKVDSENVEANN